VKWFPVSLLAALLLTAGTLSAEKPDPAAEKPAAAKKDKDKKSQDERKFDVPIAEGVPVKGLKFPYYGPDGELKGTLEAELATKISPVDIEMERARIDAVDDDGKNFHVELDTAVLNLETRVVTSPERVFVRRDDFELTGDSGEFHTKTRFAKVVGNVKMTILSTESLEQK